MKNLKKVWLALLLLGTMLTMFAMLTSYASADTPGAVGGNTVDVGGGSHGGSDLPGFGIPPCDIAGPPYCTPFADPFPADGCFYSFRCVDACGNVYYWTYETC